MVRAILAVAQIMNDPDAAQKLKAIQKSIVEPLNYARQVNPTGDEVSKAAERGTCPTCGREYAFKGESGGIRRHGRNGKCVTDNQMAAELIPAILLIASLGGNENGANDGSTHS